MASYQKVPRRLRWWRTEGRSHRKAAGPPEQISGAEKRKRNGAPCRRRISGGGAVFGAVQVCGPSAELIRDWLFMAKIYNSHLPGFRKFLEMLRKIGRSIKTGLTKHFMSGTVTTSYERGCGQDEEVVQSYCRSGCQGRRRILLRRKLPLYDRHYYGRHYGVHFCCHYFHYWHNSIWLAWGTERLSL